MSCNCNATDHNDPAAMAAAIRRNYAAADADTARDGIAWYADAEALIRADAEHYGLPVSTVAAVYAACSINASWAANRTMARKWLQYATGKADRPGGLSAVQSRCERAIAERPETFEHAFEIVLAGGDARGSKVASFVSNFHGRADFVTVDRWAMVGAGLAETTVNSKGRVTPCDAHSKAPKGVKYDRIADAYRTVAAEYGIAPRDLQAVVWCAVRGAAA